jgi:hypothetical protein
MKPKKISALSKAKMFLRGALAKGALSSVVVREKAKRAGICWATTRRAQSSLGIKPQKVGGFLGTDKPEWLWALPSTEGAQILAEGIQNNMNPAPDNGSVEGAQVLQEQLPLF